ncbi:hypothetical protein QQS21_007482 [Conoideocrella luteorostrata]|uniref:Uncharacterized protein n=1 Tax=Conoideocrella luteorostrata TaxID=1105319 RepID=A0AAJ0FZF3_9HYPO|nr:hypothetical protein QQS21_007482 [Conoideocrella luteorostrata]
MTLKDHKGWQTQAANLQFSEDEFFAFHESHYSAHAVANFTTDFAYPPPRQGGSDNLHTNTGQEETEDDLGYYHDGVKRTLTDEQIEIFRHSELRELEKKLERAKTLKKTNADENTAGENGPVGESAQRVTTPTNRNNKRKKKKGGNNIRHEPKPDLRKRTWDVVDAGLDSLDYD